MFIYLSKLLPLLVYPPGLTLVLLLLAGALRRWKRRLATALTAFAILSLWALSISPVSDFLMTGLESQYREPPVPEVPQGDAIVVLGGYLHAAIPGRPEVEITGSADRLWMGAKLYRARKAPLVLLTGGNVFESDTTPEAVVAKDLLHEWGVPLEAIEVESQSRNTRENAALSKQVLDRKGAKHILLVTSAVHMPRALAIFRRAGMDVTPVPTDYQAGWGNRNLALRLTPDVGSLQGSCAALREWIGLIVYKLRGWA